MKGEVIRTHRAPGFKFVARGEWCEGEGLTLLTGRVNGKLFAVMWSDECDNDLESKAEQMFDDAALRHSDLMVPTPC